MPRSRMHPFLPLLFSLIVIGIIGLYGMEGIFESMHKADKDNMSIQLAKMQTIGQLRQRLWSGAFAGSLLSISSSSDLQTFAMAVDGSRQNIETIRALAGRDRKAVLEGLKSRMEEKEFLLLQDFVRKVGLIRSRIQTLSEHYDYEGMWILNRRGEPYLGTDDNLRTLSAEKQAVLKRAMDTNCVSTLPAYRIGDRLYVDVVVPVLEPGGSIGDIAGRSIGCVFVSIDMRRRLENVRSHISESIPGGRNLLAEEDDEGNLFVLTYEGDSVRLPLNGWKAEGNVISFDERYLPDMKGLAYSYGQRLDTTGLFTIVALDKSIADQDLKRGILEDRRTVLGVFLGIMFMLLLCWMQFFRWRETRIVADKEYAAMRHVQRRQILDCITRSNSMAIACTDFDDKLTYANEDFAVLAGRSAREAASLGRAPLSALPLDLSSVLAKQAAEVWASGTEREVETTLVRDGRTRTYRHWTYPYFDGEGFLSGTVVVMQELLVE